MGYTTGAGGGFDNGTSDGCFDWTEATRSRANHGSQTEGGSSARSADPERAAPNVLNVPDESRGNAPLSIPMQGFPDLFEGD
jgi:hypothetical protein